VSQNILKHLPELIEAGIISPEKASEIRIFYQQKSPKSQNRLIIVFGILGAILVGLGIILIIAHNWDELPRSARTTLAFIPLIIGQLTGIFVIMRKREDIAWREGTSAFIFFAVGASISLVSQIYNIPGNLSSFLLIWMMLCLPLVYLMKSSITALLVIIGITYYACETSYWHFPNETSGAYWLLLAMLLPHYYLLLKRNPESNFLVMLNWFFPLSITICLGTLAKSSEDLMFIAYFSLFGFFYLTGNSSVFANKLIRNNAYLVIGSAGTITMLLMLSFDWFWNDLAKAEINLLNSNEFYIAMAVSFAALVLAAWQIKNRQWKEFQLMNLVFILFIFIYIIGIYSTLVSVVMINLLIFILGLNIIKKGADCNHLGILNYGLTIITALVICRFFDTDISFVIRGLLFVMIGGGFFMANYMMLKKRKTHE
jgi:uncharacterized membrane protein